MATSYGQNEQIGALVRGVVALLKDFVACDGVVVYVPGLTHARRRALDASVGDARVHGLIGQVMASTQSVVKPWQGAHGRGVQLGVPVMVEGRTEGAVAVMVSTSALSAAQADLVKRAADILASLLAVVRDITQLRCSPQLA